MDWIVGYLANRIRGYTDEIYLHRFEKYQLSGS